MAILNNKIDFAIIITANRANPNGDPLDGNRPRTDSRGYGEITDVCIKRKLRNRLQDMGCSIFVQSDDRRAEGDSFRSLKDRADNCPALKECIKEGLSREDYALKACEEWYDVRAFGQVFAFKGKKSKKDDDGEGSDAVSIGIRGPVTIQSAFSVSPVNITTTQITKSVNLETESDPDKKGSDTIGQKHRVDFGMYVTYGSINVHQARKTGFSEEDAAMMKEALRTLFVNDETSARPSGSMEVVKLIWWTHSNQIGQYSPAKVHRLLDINLKDGIDDITSADDYEIKVNELPELDYEVIDGM